MNTRFSILLCSVVIICICSCNTPLLSNETESPEDYQEEIEDLVRFNVALINTMANTYGNYIEDSKGLDWQINSSFWSIWSGKNDYQYFDACWDQYCDSIFDFNNYIDSIWFDTESSCAYLEVLQEISKNVGDKWNTIATHVLEEYMETSVLISDYKRIETSSDAKMWYFRDYNSGLEGSFLFESDDIWRCEILESSFSKILSYKINNV